MAEAAGLVIGGVSLAAIFDQCLSIIKYVDSGMNIDSSHRAATLELTLLGDRLSQWSVDFQTGIDSQATEKDGRNAKEALEQISKHLKTAQELSNHYATENTQLSGVVDRAKQKRHGINLGKRARWAFFDEEKMTALVKQLDRLVSSLEKILASLQHRRAQNLQGAQTEAQVLPGSTILPRLDANFIDREELLEDIQARTSVKGAWVALVGLGGAGKTQLAINYLKTLQEQDPTVWTLWIFAGNADRFEESIHDLAEQLRLPRRQEPKINKLQLLQNWLADPTHRWVIVLDNTDDAEFLRQPLTTAGAVLDTKPRIEYFPSKDHGIILVTSRSKQEAHKLVDESNVIDVHPMDEEHAKALLKKKLGRLYKEDEGTRLAAALEYIPLALSQAASFIKQKTRYDIANYLTELEKGRETRTRLLRQHGSVPLTNRAASSSILLTWTISFEHIHKTRSSAADLLAVMSCCDRQAIPEILVRSESRREDANDANKAGVDDDDRSNGEDGLDEDIQTLEDFSFISPKASSATRHSAAWTMHRLVQDSMQAWLRDSGNIQGTQRKYIERLYAVVPDNAGHYENWQTCQMLMPHVRSAIEPNLEDRNTSLRWAWILLQMASYDRRVGNLLIAEEFSKTSLRIDLELLGENHSDALWPMSAVAEIDAVLGRWRQAEERRLKVVDIAKTLLGPEDPTTLKFMSDLAWTYYAQGRYSEAEQIHEIVFEGRKTILGPDSLSTLKSMNSLAITYSVQGRLSDAEKLYRQGLEARIRVLGEEHPDTLGLMDNLVVLHGQQGRWSEAECLGQDVLKIRTELLGPEHPDTLNSIASLASTCRGQGRWNDSEKLEVRLLELRKRALGPEHPNTLLTMSNLAVTYCCQGRWKETEELWLQLLETEKRVLGPDHQLTMLSMANLAAIYTDQQRLPDASEMAKECLRLRTAVLGVEHPNTLWSAGLLERIERRMREVSVNNVRKEVASLKV